MYATSPQRKNVTKYLNIQNTQSSIIIYVYGVADAVHFHGICPKKISRLSFYAILFLMRLQKNCTKYHLPCLAIRRESTATKSIWMMYYGTRDSRQLRGHHKPTFYKIWERCVSDGIFFFPFDYFQALYVTQNRDLERAFERDTPCRLPQASFMYIRRRSVGGFFQFFSSHCIHHKII